MRRAILAPSNGVVKSVSTAGVEDGDNDYDKDRFLTLMRVAAQ